MVRHKDFGSPASSDEPITFSLYGENFRCRASLQGRALMRFISMSSDNDNPGEAAKAVMEFFDNAIVAEDRDRFTAMAESEDKVVSMDTLGSIMEWLMEQYAGRPTTPSSPSGHGDMITGPTPTATPSSPESVPMPMPVTAIPAASLG